MPSRNTIELQMLYIALAEPIGIVIETDNVPLAIQRLQKAKRESGDPALGVIQIRQSPTADERHSEVWITRKVVAESDEIEQQTDGETT